MFARFYITIVIVSAFVGCFGFGVSLAFDHTDISDACDDTYNGTHVAPLQLPSGVYLNVPHVFCGELRPARRGAVRAVGFHYREGGNNTRTGVFGTVSQNCTSTLAVHYYEGNATVSNSTDSAVKPVSTFFPDSMTPQQVLTAINNAYLSRNATTGVGNSNMGFNVATWPSRGNATLLDSAYPICQ